MFGNPYQNKTNSLLADTDNDQQQERQIEKETAEIEKKLSDALTKSINSFQHALTRILLDFSLSVPKLPSNPQKLLAELNKEYWSFWEVLKKLSAAEKSHLHEVTFITSWKDAILTLNVSVTHSKKRLLGYLKPHENTVTLSEEVTKIFQSFASLMTTANKENTHKTADFELALTECELSKKLIEQRDALQENFKKLYAANQKKINFFKKNPIEDPLKSLEKLVVDFSKLLKEIQEQKNVSSDFNNQTYSILHSLNQESAICKSSLQQTTSTGSPQFKKIDGPFYALTTAINITQAILKPPSPTPTPVKLSL